MQPEKSFSHTNASAEEVTVAYTSPVANMVATTPSWRRWWRQVSYLPWLHSRWLTKTVQQQLTEAVAKAEQGHRGELVLVVENHLPIQRARVQNSLDRALELFGHYRVWDTAENTGVLIYLNLCEQRLEIVADRGINQHVMPAMWQAMCDKALAGMADQRHLQSLVELLQDVGQLLGQYYRVDDDPSGNELPDQLIFLA